jgi:hypothetical protein
VITSVIRESSNFWDVMPCSPVEAHRHFVVTCCHSFSVEELVKKPGNKDAILHILLLTCILIQSYGHIMNRTQKYISNSL